MTEQEKIEFAEVLFHARNVVKAHPDPEERAKVAALCAYLMGLTLCEYELLLEAGKLMQHLFTANRSPEDETVMMHPDVEMFSQFRLDPDGWMYPLDFRLQHLLSVEIPG